jgi:hypothetical protein
MAYVYRHIRLDKNEPFYIGFGSDNSYKRSRQKHGRSKHWADIAKNGYEIDIIIDNLTYENALIKEIEFIKLYGRKDLGVGTLCNYTNGGEGLSSPKLKDYYLSRKGKSSHKHNQQSKLKISESHKGLKQSKETIEKKSKKIVQSTLNGKFIKIWPSARNVQRELKLSQGNISKCCSGQYGQAYGFKWEYLNKNK